MKLKLNIKFIENGYNNLIMRAYKNKTHEFLFYYYYYYNTLIIFFKQILNNE